MSGATITVVLRVALPRPIAPQVPPDAINSRTDGGLISISHELEVTFKVTTSRRNFFFWCECF